MVKKGDTNRLHLPKSRLALAVLCCALLLAGTARVRAIEVPEHLYINEFMANNDDAVAGPYNDYPDWIELYNGGTESVDLSGMYLSDDLANPDSWQFPEGTTIDAGGFLVV